MAGRPGPNITLEGVEACMAAFQSLETSLRRNANGELRAASKAIASGMQPLLGGSGAPQETAILAAAGPKSDRFVVLAIPSRKPKLSGLRKMPAARARTLAYALESGSTQPQFRGPAKDSLVFGHRKALMAYALPRYQRALAGIMRKYGLL